MSEIKATENGLGIQADKITLEGPETRKTRRLFVCRHSAGKLTKTIRSRSAEKSAWTRALKVSRGTLRKNGSGQGTYLPKRHTKSEILACICCC